MSMLRALSTRNGSRRGGYDRLQDETINDPIIAPSDPDHVVLKRVSSVPARMLFGSSSKKQTSDTIPEYYTPKPKKEQKTKKSGKSHPVFSLFDGKWGKKKMTANPDLPRYLQYLKEGGVWNKETNSPAMYYK